MDNLVRPCSPRQSRKGESDPENWKRNVAKRERGLYTAIYGFDTCPLLNSYVSLVHFLK